MRACVRAFVRACVRACVCVCVLWLLCAAFSSNNYTSMTTAVIEADDMNVIIWVVILLC